MSKNIREILKNKMVVSGVIVATVATIAVGIATTKKTNTDKKIENKVAQVEEFNKDESKDDSSKVEDKVDSKVVEANVSETDKTINEVNKTNDNANLKTTKQPSSVKKIVKPIKTKKIVTQKVSIKKTPIKAVDTKENLGLLNQRDKLDNQVKDIKNDIKIEKPLYDKTNVDKTSDSKKVNTKDESLTNSKEVLAKIAELENKIKAKKENIKATILKDLDSTKNINPKSIEEMATLSNKIINATENAKAYNKMILDDKKSTEEMKKEAQNLLERANKELKRITVLAEAVNAKSKDLTWTECLTNLYNYASGEISNVYNYVVEEGTKAYNDVAESATKAYNASKNIYDTAIYTYDNFDTVKEAAKDLSEVSSIVNVFDKEASGILTSVQPFVKDYKSTDSYLDIAKEKANGVINFVEVELNVDNLNKLSAKNKENTSIVSPITNIVDNVSNFTNHKTNKIKNTVTLSKGYVGTKNASKKLFSSFLNMF